eukprot:359544-Chlamydomonas_euryale.AAC.3
MPQRLHQLALHKCERKAARRSRGGALRRTQVARKLPPLMPQALAQQQPALLAGTLVAVAAAAAGGARRRRRVAGVVAAVTRSAIAICAAAACATARMDTAARCVDLCEARSERGQQVRPLLALRQLGAAAQELIVVAARVGATHEALEGRQQRQQRVARVDRFEASQEVAAVRLLAHVECDERRAGERRDARHERRLARARLTHQQYRLRLRQTRGHTLHHAHGVPRRRKRAAAAAAAAATTPPAGLPAA